MGLCGGCSRVCRQFSLLLWKNFILQFRRPIGTVFEWLIPVAAVVFILVVKLVIPSFRPEDRCFVTFESDPLTIPTNVSIPPALPLPPLPSNFYNIFYTSPSTEGDEVAGILSNKLPNDTFNFMRFESEEKMVLGLQSFNNSLFGCFRDGAGIVFNNLSGNDLSYTIRLRHEVGNDNSWETAQSGPNFELPGPRIANSYLSEGFLHLQQLVAESIIEWKAGASYVPIDVSVRQFPYPPYRVDFFLQGISNFLPILLVMAFLYSAGILVKELVLEKETRIRETMLMMGLRQWILWTTWFLKEFIFLMLPIIIISILLKVGVFSNSDFFILLILFTLFLISMISFCFFVSVWFNSARIGFIVGFVAWFVNYFPYLFLSSRYDTLSLGSKIGSCFLSNTCLGLAVEVISRLEQRQEGVTWGNIANPVSSDDSFNLAWVFCMLIVDSFLYMAVAWYINEVKPGTYGVPKPFYFPFLPSYWCGNACSKPNEVHTGPLSQSDPSSHELLVDHNKHAGIKIRNLTKIYSLSLFQFVFDWITAKKSEKKKAVDDLSLDMYKDEITVLLGHNGAGKTTTMSILTGLYTPTSGTAEINGCNILTGMDEVRRSLGICPQHNILFDRLTVQEHLNFFLRLKGISNGIQVKQEVSDMIADLQLTDKAKIQSSRLSGGQKRKLSVGIALVGGSEIVILDEPTSGMDPYARRATWDLLTKHKQNRTMLLTTHFMDEADLLGDRIAIMAEGKLRCSGSSLFLKGRYGVGYHMIVVKEATCVSSKVEELIHSFVTEAKQVTDVGAELSFILPSSATGVFPDLFDTLDAQKASLGISSFGVSVTTMEEVFMKVGEGTNEILEDRLRRKALSPNHRPIGQSKSPPPYSVDDTIQPASPQKEKATVVVSLEDGEDQTSHPDVSETTIDIQPNQRQRQRQRQRQDSDTVGLAEEETALTYNFKPNTGVVLWFQQYYAMIIKRFYNTLRFYGALFSQLLLPLLFVIFGLVVVVTVPNTQVDDIPRALRVNTSGLSDTNFVFFAEFGGSLNLSNIEAGDIQATNYFNYTSMVQAIMNRVNSDPPSELEDCCLYEHQLLDKFCASRTPTELDACTNTNTFGYRLCKDCLSCSNATEFMPPSCSHPANIRGNTNNNNFCPNPPSLDVSSTLGTTLSGTLSSVNTYVAEYLISEAIAADPAVFYRQYQAGFTITEQDPILSVCGCGRDDRNVPGSGICRVLDLVEPCGAIENCPVYSLPSQDCMNISMRPNLCEGDSCYNVDATSSDFIKFLARNMSTNMCQERDLSNHIVSTVYPDQPSTSTATVWYNNAAFHVPAAALNAFHNVLLKRYTGMDDLTLTVINHPLPRNATSQVDSAIGDATGFGLSILIVFGYSFLLASFVLFPVQEKESKAKHLQFVSGVSSTSYWLSSYTWDLINASVPIIITIIIFAAFQVDAYSGAGLGAVFLVLILASWASIPITYIFSFLFSNSLAAFGILVIMFFFVSLFALSIVFLVQINVDNSTADALHFIFLLSPTYGLASALNDIYLNQNTINVCRDLAAFCEANGIRFVNNPLDFERPGVGIICLYLFIEGVVFFSLTLLIQRKFFIPEIKSLVARENSLNPNTASEPLLPGEDSDVYAERKKVMGGETTKNDAVVIKNLTKVYSSHCSGCSIVPPKTAVNGINLAIPSGECFGLLGVNGAGKTTTFGILTGDVPMSSGTAIIAGHDVRMDLKKVQQRVGYCPQFDALIERLTGRELLTMYARLRGIPEKQIKAVVDTEIRRLDLLKYANKSCGSYSGGNKRKLSTAIALVGNPPIVMLDEPTTGMDPNTRRYLWDVLTNVTQEGRSIILTSHSMEECEALCTRLAIMVNGTFKCLGSIQHLKNKYGAGFTLQAKVKLSPEPEGLPLTRSGSKGRFSLRRSASSKSRQGERASSNPQENSPPRVVEVNSEAVALGGGGGGGGSVFNPYDTTSLHIFIRESFSGAVLMEEHQGGAVTYQLPSAGMTWSTVFRKLEDNKERLGIIDYSVSQTTLDQVFINFAKEQQDSDL